MRPTINPPLQRATLPALPGDPSSANRLQSLIQGMSHIDTAGENAWVIGFQRSGAVADPAERPDQTQDVLDWCA